MDPITHLEWINARLEHTNNSKLKSPMEFQRQANGLYEEAVQLRDRIDQECPDRWEEAPEMTQQPNPPLRWFRAARQATERRNARRRYIKTRLSVLRDRGLKEKAERDERLCLISEAHKLGPFENIGHDPLSTEILKLYAWNMKEDAESVARQHDICIECEAPAPPGALRCLACGTEDRIQNDDPMTDAVEYRDASQYEFSY